VPPRWREARRKPGYLAVRAANLVQLAQSGGHVGAQRKAKGSGSGPSASLLARVSSRTPPLLLATFGISL